MNFIDTIEIKNFKSIRHQKIEGCKRVNVFVGYPNVGKSNILEAISLGSYANDEVENSSSLNKLCRLSSFSELFNDGNIKAPMEIVYNDNLSFLFEYQSISSLKFTQLQKQKNNSEIKWMDIRGFDFEKAGKTMQPRKMYFVEDIIRDKPDSDFKILKYEFLKNKFTDQASALHLSFPYGENLFEVISNNKELRSDIANFFVDYGFKLSIDKENNSLKVLKELEQNVIFQIPFYQIADTLQRLIFYKAAMASNKDAILIFEEPEAHLFPRYISKLTGEIILNENNNQYFMASHSPYVLNDLISDLGNDDLALFIVSYNKEKGETIIQKMTEPEVNEAYQFGYDFFMNIGNFIQQPQHE